MLLWCKSFFGASGALVFVVWLFFVAMIVLWCFKYTCTKKTPNKVGMQVDLIRRFNMIARCTTAPYNQTSTSLPA